MSDFGESRVGRILGFLGGLFGLFGGGVPKNVKRALEGLRSVVKDIAEETASYFRENGSFLARFVGLLRRFWSAGLLPLIRWLRSEFLKLRGWLKRTLAPLFRILKKLRDEWRLFYTRILRPILDTIEAIRFGLKLLELFHVKWAKKLDDTLGLWQSWISTRFLEVLRFINALEDRVYRVITFDYLIERLVFLKTFDINAPTFIRMWWNKQVTGLTPGEAAGKRGQKYPGMPVDEPGRELGAYYSTGGGAYAGFIDEALVPQWLVAAGVSSGPVGE